VTTIQQPAPEMVFRRSNANLAIRFALMCLAVVALGAPLAWDYHPGQQFSAVVWAVLILTPAALGAAALLGAFRTQYILTPQAIIERCGRKERRVEWSAVSPFSETAPTHRDSDRHCLLKDRYGQCLLAVAPQRIGSKGRELLAEIRRRLGPPSLAWDREPEVFRFGDFPGVPPWWVELCGREVAAAWPQGSLRLPLDQIREITLCAWPDLGAGLEKARLVAGDRVLEFDSRLTGFWPLVEFIAARAPQAIIKDGSRRARLGQPLAGASNP